jgi:hypothetical protein
MCVHVRPAATDTVGGHAVALCVRASRPRLHIAANAKKHMKTQSIHERAILPQGQQQVYQASLGSVERNEPPPVPKYNGAQCQLMGMSY